jgi:hypothetical protein
LASNADSRWEDVRAQATPAIQTAAAVGVWLALERYLPTVENRGGAAAIEVFQVLVSAAAVHLAATLVHVRPKLRFTFEWLVSPDHPHGEIVRDKEFRVTPIQGSVWFRIRAAYVRRGPIARWVARGFLDREPCVELTFEPAPVVLVNVERAVGTDVEQLSQGQRGARVRLPAGLTPGEFAAFQIEIRPALPPLAVPLRSTMKLVLKPTNARYRHALVKVEHVPTQLSLVGR